MFGSDSRKFFKEIKNKILDYLKNTNYKYTQNISLKEYDMSIDYNELITFYQNNIDEMQKPYNDRIIKINIRQTLGLINDNNELENLRKDNIELRKKSKTTMGNTYNININKVENLQAGDNGNQIINKNVFNQIDEKKEEIKSIIKEIEEIKEKNNIQDGINDIFTQLLDELSKLELDDLLQPEQEKSKTILQNIYEKGKNLNDWKNITILPYEIIDKGTHIIEGLNKLLDKIN